MSMPATDTILEIEELTIRFHTRQGLVTAVDGLDLSLWRGHVLGLVGESGCGKTVMSHALIRIEAPGRIEGGRIRFYGQDGAAVAIETLDPCGAAIRRIRWKEIAMIFQEPMTSLGPQHTIGAQIAEAMELHGIASGRELQAAVVASLQSVGMPHPEDTARQYPHQISGGMRQRAMIAMALSCRPSILIADEPTTALDVSTECQILDLLRERQAALGMSILYISHNLGVVAQIAHEVAVMYLGRIVERAPVATLFSAPKHPYTQALLRSIPRVDRDSAGPLEALSGNVPEPFARPSGCSFHPRCPQRIVSVCERVTPTRVRLADGSEVSCHLYGGCAHA
jgi:oligopeptide/dipeptide ABC transporter ATP-binding protein